MLADRRGTPRLLANASAAVCDGDGLVAVRELAAADAVEQHEVASGTEVAAPCSGSSAAHKRRALGADLCTQCTT